MIFITIGVYQIKNKVNGKIYIGQSVNVEDRFYNHKQALNGNYHKNDHLQKAWNKYGEKSFKFEIIKRCKSRYLDRFERLHIHLNNSTDAQYGYNNESGGNQNKKISPQVIDKMSKPRESVSKKNNPSWKEYPRIVKCGFCNGKQAYAIRYNGKTVCRSTNLKFLEEKLKQNDFSHIYHADDFHIVKAGFDENGDQMFAICKKYKRICSSKDLELLKEKLKNNDFSPIPNSKPPRIIKAGFQKGKQVYGIYKNGKYYKRSNNLKKLEKILEEMIKQ